MRVCLDLRTGDDGQPVCVCTWEGGTRVRSVRLIENGKARVLVARDDPVSDETAAQLAADADRAVLSAAELIRYGGLLFEAAFGAEVWRELIDGPASHPYLELAIRGRADSEQPAACPLQAMRWEALHDGKTFVAAKGVQAKSGKTVSVGVVRLVPLAADHAAQPSLPITTIPKVLFAVGSRLSDRDVRPGAEFMGILRQLERNGGWIQPRVLEDASLTALTDQLTRFEPEVLHIIGHGRWDPGDRCVKLQLRLPEGEGDGDDYVTASQILGTFGASGHVPTLAVLSACQTASLPAGMADQGAAEAATVNPLPFAARLVAGGVPAVAAMAGDISDTACRIFTRSLTRAIGRADPFSLARAVIVGRSAAFYERRDPDSADWIMPVLFLAENIPESPVLVNTATAEAARKRINSLGFGREPVFCGRGEFIDAMDRLLDENETLNILVAHTADPVEGYGGYRLLQELGARAVRAGCLPVLLGPYDKAPPTTQQALGEEFRRALSNIRRKVGLEVKPSRFAAACGSDMTPDNLADELRADLDQLVEDLPETDPVRARPGYPKTVLLCHRVDKWLDAFNVLLSMLQPEGLGAGVHPVPVVMTGTDTTEQGLLLKETRLQHKQDLWIEFAPLGRFRDEGAYPEDIRAYQWWLLNPPEGKPVYTPKRGNTMNWQGLLRATMLDRPLYQMDVLFKWAQGAVDADFFTADTDNDVLTTFTKVAP